MITVEEHAIHGRLLYALRLAHNARMASARDNGYADVRIHIGSDVVAWVKSLCVTEDSRLPPASRLGGFDLIPEDEFEPGRIVVRTDREVF